MPSKNRCHWGLIGFPPALLVIATTSACIFNFEDFREPPPETGAGGSTGTQSGAGGDSNSSSSGSTGAGGSNSSSASGTGGSGGAPQKCNPSLNIDANSYEVHPSNPCYVLIKEMAVWEDAIKNCPEFISESTALVISNQTEKNLISAWLKGQPNEYRDIWTGGQRNYDDSDSDVTNDNSFQWYKYGSEADPFVKGDDWLIFPCDGSSNKCNDDQGAYWGSWNSTPQPDKSGRCVQFATSSPAWEGAEGLDDEICMKTKGYICESTPK